MLMKVGEKTKLVIDQKIKGFFVLVYWSLVYFIPKKLE
ncbi:unnamed protein product [Musa acuminata subsp. malaccensis]|uniref:(wild Malaysian banana) hypothetical protein n=1 Tax=Musa acuminata subsp. malaccensis TaxID=214687 RepID=A0A804L7C7_MUSAM|nr:unnamed protein product [Musa acuminata subsp. malaccensis]